MSCVSIGIDFGGTSIKLNAVKSGELLDKTVIISNQEKNFETLFKELTKNIQTLLDKYPGTKAIGIGLPGIINHRDGIIKKLVNVAGWDNLPIQEILSEKFNLPVAIDNDVNCMTLAESRWGGGQGYSSLCCLTLGTGVGGGIMLNNELLRGANFMAGEVGQTSICFKGAKGPLGNIGALESFIGNKQIEKYAQQVYLESSISKMTKDCTPLGLYQAAEKGDEIAQRIYKEIAHKLAVAISNIIWLIDPDKILIGGGIAQAGRHLFNPLNQYLREFCAHSKIIQDGIEPAKLSISAGIIGAATLALTSA